MGFRINSQEEKCIKPDILGFMKNNLKRGCLWLEKK